MDALKQAMARTAVDVEAALQQVMAADEEPERRLFDAMRYAALGGGKRLRPFLVLETAGLFSVARKSALRAAAAIELVHCYSLVHDDLPAMDDDDLRRGKPTVHKAFDEATAILAGDALLTLAFEVLAHPDTHSNPEVRCRLTSALAHAAGAYGMVAGQMIDLSAAGRDMDIGEITRLQRLKTGALIRFACEAGPILGQAAEAQHEALRGYAHDLGLAFQIADDLLDVEGTAEEVGKAVGKDSEQGKATFVSILGAARAHEQANILVDQAVAHLAIFDEKADFLREVARYIVERRS
jgi:farnesyl diphosphate synthase